MEKRSVTLKLPKQVWDALLKRDPSLEQAIATVLQSHVTRSLRVVDTGLDDAFRQSLVSHFEKARSWPELQGRLKLIGLSCRVSHDGLALFDSATRQRVCGLKRLGWSESKLVEQFGRPFPQAIRRWHCESMIDGTEDQSKTVSGGKQTLAATAHRR
ncbi:hypothetical protein [uncultured Pelagimonas sp.]|uniref:hypothetical protein n=1 Tax=uncultured Pelagimonas sp. TaxID=1618102 RepID=UPI00260D2BF7|nr:hypothetical protein [uncultured Pelagimonas sp.]